MTKIRLIDRDGRPLAAAYHTPTGEGPPLLVTWQGRYFLRHGVDYREAFPWPVFTREDLEMARLEGLIT